MTAEEAAETEAFIRKVWSRRGPMAEEVRYLTGGHRQAVKPTVPLPSAVGGTEYVIFMADRDGMHGKWRGVDVLVEPYA